MSGHKCIRGSTRLSSNSGPFKSFRGKQNFKAGLALLLQGMADRKAAKEAIMTDAERREKARLRSERWRRAHGIGPRRPAQRPWLAEGISPFDMVQAQAAGTASGGCGLCMCHPRTSGSLRGSVDPRPRPMRGA